MVLGDVRVFEVVLGELRGAEDGSGIGRVWVSVAGVGYDHDRRIRLRGLRC